MNDSKHEYMLELCNILDKYSGIPFTPEARKRVGEILKVIDKQFDGFGIIDEQIYKGARSTPCKLIKWTDSKDEYLIRSSDKQQNELAQYFNCSVSTIKRRLDYLSERGFIVRQKKEAKNMDMQKQLDFIEKNMHLPTIELARLLNVPRYTISNRIRTLRKMRDKKTD